MIPKRVVVFDDRAKLTFEFQGQKVGRKQDAVIHGLMSPLDLAL